jgi:hypothetical protein
MHIEYRISERDYQSASTLARRKSSNVSAFDHYFPYIFSVAWVVAGVIPSTANAQPADSSDLFFELGVIPVLVGFLWKRRSRLRREYEKASGLHLLHQLDLDASGLRLVTTMGTTRTSWQVYTKFAENENVFILFQEKKLGFLTVVKEFLTTLQIDELRALLLAHIPRA